MKRIAVATVCLAAAVGVGFAANPDEVRQYAGVAADAARPAWDAVAANPVPVALAVGTFLVTVLYHTAKGLTLRQSVEAAATGETETLVVRRAKARATRTQLLADQIALENRLRKLPDAVVKAERDVCYTEQALADFWHGLDEKQTAHDAAVSKLAALRKEKAEGDAEMAAIVTELKKLADVA